MSGDLSLQNRQCARAVDLRQLRRITNTLLVELLSADNFELGVHLVAMTEMTRLNQSFLHHAGSTDVITFDYATAVRRVSQRASRNKPRHANPLAPSPRNLHGEIFICLDEALTQSRKYRTSWQAELVRYLVHGLLHLHGFNDSQTAARRKMKHEENRLLRELARRFPLSKLRRQPRVAP